MSYNNWLSQSFALVFLAIVMAGLFLSVSVKLAFVTLCVAFGMNALLFLACLFQAIAYQDEVDFEIHP